MPQILMPINLPPLEEGRIYHRPEVESFIGNQTGTSDFDVMSSHFPRGLKSWQHDGRGWRDGEEIVLQYQVFSMKELKHQILEFEQRFRNNPNDQERVNVIVNLLRKGECVFPVFVQQNDPERRIVEGHHRSVALMQLESYCVPAFLAGYSNWFQKDEPSCGFKQEEIVTATLHEVYAFFMHATCVDHKGLQIALFDSDRLRLCDEALVAMHDGKIIGAAAFTVAKGKPTFSTIYVLRQFRRKGIAYRLCESALMRFKNLGISGVACDVQSLGMEATLIKLARDRPELRVLLDSKIGYLSGEDVEMGLGDV